MMKPRPLALVLALAGVAATPYGAAAQPAKPTTVLAADAVSRADAFYKQGVRLYSDKKWMDAKAAFLSAFALNPTFDVAFNLGSSEFQLGEHRDAAEHLSFALRNWPLTSAVSALRAIAQQRLDESKTFVAAITVKVNIPHAEVVVDGSSAGQSPLKSEVFVTPGSHTIAASLDGYNGAKSMIQVEKGSTKTITLDLITTPAPVPTVVSTAEPIPAGKPLASGGPIVPPVPVPPPPRSVVPGVVLAGVGASALAIGIGFMVDAGAKGSRSEELNGALLGAGHSCVVGATNYDARCEELNTTSLAGTANHRIGVGLLVGAGVAAAAAGAYFLWPVSRSDSPSIHAVRVSPAVSASDAGFILSGAF